MNKEPKIHMINPKTIQLLSIGKETLLLVLPITAILLAAPATGQAQKAESVKAPDQIVLAGDALDKVSEAYIKGLFDAQDRDETLVKDRLSRDEYNSKQKHRFELHESRKGLGMAYFRTNEGNYGKLLYTWGIGPKLHLKEIVVFDSRSGKTIVRTGRDIVLQKAGHYDLDTGLGTHPNCPLKGKPPNDYRPDLHCTSIYGEDRHLTAVDGASFLFPISENAKAPGQIALADDAFGKVSEAYIKGLFDGEDQDEKLVKDRLSRDEYNSKQKHRFELHESRKGLGLAYFRTNQENYGKLLYTWGVGSKLHLKEIVVFDSRSGKAVVRRGDDIVLQKAGHMDLDSGIGTHLGVRLPNDYHPDLHCGSVYGEDRHLKATDGASFLFPIDAD